MVNCHLRPYVLLLVRQVQLLRQLPNAHGIKGDGHLTLGPVVVHSLDDQPCDAAAFFRRQRGPATVCLTSTPGRKRSTLTGDESRVAEVRDVDFPTLLDPTDDLPPATVITHVVVAPGGKV